MAKVDLHKLALRLKVIEMLGIYSRRRCMEEAHQYWRSLILPN